MCHAAEEVALRDVVSGCGGDGLGLHLGIFVAFFSLNDAMITEEQVQFSGPSEIFGYYYMQGSPASAVSFGYSDKPNSKQEFYLFIFFLGVRIFLVIQLHQQWKLHHSHSICSSQNINYPTNTAWWRLKPHT